MKRNIGLLLGLLALSIALIACGSENSQKEHSDDFVVVSATEEISENDSITKIKEKETGCYYLYYKGYRKGGLTQVFVEVNGASVPHCEPDS